MGISIPLLYFPIFPFSSIYLACAPIFSSAPVFRFVLRELPPIVLGIYSSVVFSDVYHRFFHVLRCLTSIFSCSSMSEMSPEFDLISIYIWYLITFRYSIFCRSPIFLLPMLLQYFIRYHFFISVDKKILIIYVLLATRLIRSELDWISCAF